MPRIPSSVAVNPCRPQKEHELPYLVFAVSQWGAFVSQKARGRENVISGLLLYGEEGEKTKDRSSASNSSITSVNHKVTTLL
jgi:hypothetical protein